jgi:hypothetical protein
LCPKLRCRDADAGVQNDSVAFDVARDVAQAGSVANSDDNEKLDGDDERHFNFFFAQRLVLTQKLPLFAAANWILVFWRLRKMSFTTFSFSGENFFGEK